MRRRYRSGTQWCLWRWSDIDTGHIDRLHIIKTPWFALCLHWIMAPDPEPFEHDHPVSFLSIVLRGGYLERRNGKKHWVRWLNILRASPSDSHRIVGVEWPPTVTLCLMGPKRREWGFHTDRGWVGWHAYYEGSVRPPAALLGVTEGRASHQTDERT